MASISERENREIEAANASGNHPGRLHPRPLGATEQLGELGGLLQAGRLRARRQTGQTIRQRLKRPGRTRTSSPRRP